MTLDKRRAPVLAQYGFFLTQQPARMADARKLLLSASQIDPQNATVTYGLARIALRTGNYAEAVARLTALTINADNQNSPEIWSVLADAYRRLGDTVRAEQAARQAAAIEKTYADYVHVREQLEKMPGNVALYLQLARLYAKRHEYEKALVTYRTYQTLAGNDPKIQQEVSQLTDQAKRQGYSLNMPLFELLSRSP
jgi:cytochrome c-type biogenesis protein CcmH/NrfG